jgi:type III pantothenate kinase
MFMLLAIDIGNSIVNINVTSKGTSRFLARIATDTVRTEDQIAVELSAIFKLYDTKLVRKAVKKLTGLSPLLIGPGIKTGLNICIDNPAQLGADMVAGAVAANVMYPKPCIIFDLGTATKATVIDKKGNCIGATIMAGVAISLEALSNLTAQLPHINLEDTTIVIGKNTVDSMKSGTVLGTASMLDGMAERIEDILGEKATLIITGGLADVIMPHCRRKVIPNPTLVLDGLRIIYERNLAGE